MEIWQVILLGAVATVAGFVNVNAGGGSLMVMPTLVFLGFDGPMANGTTRIALLAQNLTAVATFKRRGYSEFKLSLTLAACALPGAAIGAMLGTRLEGVWFNRILAVMMGVVLILMIKGRNPARDNDKLSTPRNLLLGHALIVATGFYGGFLQAGVGFIIMPILHNVLGLDLVRVNMHKVFIIGAYTIVAVVVFAISGHVDWIVGTVLATGMSFGGWCGSHFAVSAGQRAIRVVLNITLVGMIIRLLMI